MSVIIIYIVGIQNQKSMGIKLNLNIIMFFMSQHLCDYGKLDYL